MARRTQVVVARVVPARTAPSGARVRSGFTLVELLVVISIIGMLAALLLPAVNQAREAGRKSVCLNNQKQLGLALVQYEQRQNSYPGYVNPQATDATGPTRPVGWMFSILPFLERQDIVEGYGSPSLKPGVTVSYANQPPNQALKIAICPSDARAEAKNPSPVDETASASSYVVNCGLKDLDQTTLSTVARDWPANGVFHYNYPYSLTKYAGGGTFTSGAVLTDFDVTAGTYPDISKRFESTAEPVTKVTTSFISGGDGTTTTLMLSENVDCGNWTNIWETNVGFVWQAGPNGTATPSQAAGSNSDNLTVNLKRINENVGEVDQQATPDAKKAFGRPSSYHPGAVNATFCDGHSISLSDNIDYVVYCQLMTPRGKASTTNAPSTPTKFAVTSGYQVYGTLPLNEKDF